MLQQELFAHYGPWVQVRDGDPRLRILYNRHYSARRNLDGRRPKKIVGPGEYIALITPSCDALFVWRKFRSMDGQQGVNCAVFRNETRRYLSSYLILEAMKVAWTRWPGKRLYTYVNPLKVRSVNPGCCFKKAGWRTCGLTKAGLIILEVFPEDFVNFNSFLLNSFAAGT